MISKCLVCVFILVKNRKLWCCIALKFSLLFNYVHHQTYELCEYAVGLASDLKFKNLYIPFIGRSVQTDRPKRFGVKILIRFACVEPFSCMTLIIQL